MYRVLLIGTLDRITEELYRTLERRYQVQLCSAKTSDDEIQAIARISKPDMVVINTLEPGDVNDTLFSMLRSLYSNIPILTIGTKENCDYYEQYFDGAYIAALYRPVTTGTIMERCARMLGDVEPAKTEACKEETEDKGMRHILIVDDSAVTLRSVKSLLDKTYYVSVATSGEMAIKTMKKNPPDLVLLDYEMPICDGRETFEMIRKDETIKDIPVIFLTAVADKKHIAAVLQLNPAGYLLKPPNIETLKEKIESVLNMQ